MINPTTSIEGYALNIEGNQLLAAIRKFFLSNSTEYL